MDPLTTALTVALVDGLFQVGSKLIESVVDASLEPSKELLKKRIQKKYRDAENDQELAQIIKDAIEQIDAPTHNQDQLASWFKETGLIRLQAKSNLSLRRMVARAVLGFVDPNSSPPPELIIALGWPKSRDTELSKLLYTIRSNLAGLEEYKDIISYIDKATERDLLQQILVQMETYAKCIIHTDGVDSLRVVLVNQSLSRDDAMSIESNYRGELTRSLRMHDLRGISQVRRGTRAPLSEIYVDIGLIHIKGEEQVRSYFEKKLISSIEERVASDIFSLDSRITDLLTEHRAVILGEPGSGKTTSLRFIALMLSYGYGMSRLGLDFPYLPILIRVSDFANELREKPAMSLINYLKNYAEQTYSNIPRLSDFLYFALEQGSCIILLDGLDEVGSSTTRSLHSEVVQKVQRFSDSWCVGKKNRVIVTSRLEGYWSEPLLDFSHYQIAPLQLPDEVRDFLQKWYVAYEQSYEKDLDVLTANKQANEKVKKMLPQIINWPSVANLATNPLLLTILALVYENIGILPNKRIKLYQIITQTFIESWRQAQKGTPDELLADLGEETITRVIAQMAYWLHENKPGGTAPINDWQSILENIFAQEGYEAASTKFAHSFFDYVRFQTGIVSERSPNQFGFFHLTFEEYLTARQIARHRIEDRKKIIRMHWEDPAWSEVIALTVGQLGIVEGRTDDASDLIEDILKMEAKTSQNSGKAAILAGKALLDVGVRNVNIHTRRWAEDDLRATMQDLNQETRLPNIVEMVNIRTRVAASEVLDELGWLPEDLNRFSFISGVGKFANIWIGQYPVTNVQYQRFLASPDFHDWRFWEKASAFDENGSLSINSLDTRSWKEKSDIHPLEPQYWHTPYFGIARRCFPVVGVSWFEANAYCRWLQHHWIDLEEKRANPMINPGLIRLPSQEEWVVATGGKELADRYPWDKPEKMTKDIGEIIQRANVFESGIGKSTSVCLYPLGSSHPYGLWDTAGNVWEWSASTSDESRETLYINGGSFYYDHEFALCSSRFWYPPDGRGPYLGFRVAIVADGVD